MTRNGQSDRGPVPGGPFPEPQGREHPWEATETERGPFDRRRWARRGADAAGSERRSPRPGRRRSDLVHRLRRPIIGLTLAGVAAPLIHAGIGEASETATSAPVQAPRQADEETAAEPTSGDLETRVGTYWADAEEAAIRDQTITGAMTRYGINRDLSEKIYDAATQNGLEPDLGYGLVFTESTFRERAVSHVGARGLTQLMPRTARWLDPSVTARDLFDPDVNLKLGFKYLRHLIDKYGGNVHNALTAYNRGPGTVDRILRRGGNPDNGYAGKVMAG